MWQSVRKQLTIFRDIINEFSPIITNSSFRSLSTPSIVSSESIQKVTSSPSVSTAPAFRLVTAHYGLSKEYFYGKTNTVTDKTKSSTFGDDAWFTVTQKYADVLGIADGVGGWRDYGIDPSKFSSSLMKQCQRLVEQDKNVFSSSSNNINEKTPVDILIESYNTLLESKDPHLIGSSTACIVVFNRDSKFLHTANLGDSGFVIIRDNKIVHRSQEQCHYFNAPFQLAILPNYTEDSFNDKPQMASVSSFELAEGDFIVLGTDGLWDNLFEHHLLLKVSKIKCHSIESLAKEAQSIANFAAELSQDPNYLSPFALSARKQGIDFRGGKPDDITILLAKVTRS